MSMLLAFALLATAAAAANNTDYQTRWYHDCGTSSYPDAGSDAVPYIIGGHEARMHEFPYQCALRFRPGLTGGQFCGCILIHPQYALTAAHCMFGAPLFHFDVVLGDHNRKEMNEHKQVMEIEYYYNHGHYGKAMWFDKDITVIKFKQPAKLSEYVKPICAPNPDNLYVGEMGTVSGFGTTTTEYWAPAVTLKYVTTLVPPNWACDIAHWSWGYVTDNMVCAGKIPDFDNDSCNGDSGGPMAVRGPNGKFEAVGIVSWGVVCASGPPGVYTRVGNFLDWVDAKMKLLSEM